MRSASFLQQNQPCKSRKARRPAEQGVTVIALTLAAALTLRTSSNATTQETGFQQAVLLLLLQRRSLAAAAAPETV
jgi:hypothetical protein